ncbi:MAG: hypothetical protein HETSPECPRED_000156 [Heterodermia speciosa]|uniref:Patatin-like phospholipase domain-containing protein n=1 Tax=Heterodermia speciosa TaxID=116794 RepID=A0A8H3EEJ6_9LECA|nr:MAG: hypothetical protein HETSPECPRED_000156 [Heterodermia speciosa]
MPISSTSNERFESDTLDPSTLPDYETEFIKEADLDEFAKALNAPESSPLVALNDWRPIHQKVRRKSTKGRKKKSTSMDETREGFAYSILKWPLLLVVFGWIIVLGASYLATRLYIYGYERFVTWRGTRQRLRRNMRGQTDFESWKKAAGELDAHLGNETWKAKDDYAYYDHDTVRNVKEQLKASRTQAKCEEKEGNKDSLKEIANLQSLVEACVKNNFVGVENPRLYSETYYGTKHLAQDFIDELQDSLAYLIHSSQLSQTDKYAFARHLHTNFGRTALCLSGGASFAYYHFGVAKALLDANLLPEVITGTSGGAIVAALLATRTDEELKLLIVPALAHRINACSEGFTTWVPRWYRTGARFDSVKWAREAGWFTRGSMTFREAYERTGRILNVTCVPSDPHSPTILCNYLTAPNCVIWSAVLASAAVPGILNPVVLMNKSRSDGKLAPYSFGHKWKDGSLRTDIPLKALNTQFNVQFSIVSQVNPHINLFFFSSRGAIGRPVTHRKGRGWRGGYLGSATETYLKLDLNKWLKVLKHLELLPRPLGQDWTGIWLQQFSGTITIWPKTHVRDFWYILSDPSPQRLARMIRAGMQSTYPKVLFVQNRMKIERLIEEGLLLGRGARHRESGDSLHLHGRAMRLESGTGSSADDANTSDVDMEQFKDGIEPLKRKDRRTTILQELKRQSGVFFDDPVEQGEDEEETDGTEGWASAVEDGEGRTKNE